MAEEVGSLRIDLGVDTADFSRSMTDINRKLRGLNSEFKANTAGADRYDRSLEGLRTRSDYLNNTLTLQRQRMEQLKREYDQSVQTKGRDAKETENLAIRYNRASEQMQRTENQLEQTNKDIERQTDSWQKLSRSMEQGGRRLQTVGRGMRETGQSMSMYVTAPIVAAGAAAVTTGMQFEEGMSQVQAVSGATEGQMEQLEEQARELGSTTRYSATEAADGMQFLSKAGYEVNETIESMPAVLDLATAGAMDLGNAADITSNIMSGFALNAEETGHMSDVLAKAASSANTDVQQLGDAMTYLAPAANTLGWNMEEATAAVMAMSDAGIQGQRAGAAFSTSLNRLANPTAKAQGVIEDLNLELFNAEGQMKSMPEVIAEFNDGMEGMSDKQRAAAVSTVVGQEAYKNWSVLLEQGSSALAENTEMLQSADGAAASMAETMNDNAMGAWREMKSSLQETGLVLSETLLPIAEDAMESIRDLSVGFQNLDESTQKFIITAGGITAATGPALMAFGSMAQGVGAISTGVSKLLPLLGGKAGLATAARALTGPVGLATTAVVGLGAAAWKVHDSMQASKEASAETAKEMTNNIDSLDQSITRWEELDKASNLSNQEMSRYIELQKSMKEVTDPETLLKMKQEQDNLQEKSGLTNEQLNEFIEVNRTIVEEAPATEGALGKYGETFANNTKEARKQLGAMKEIRAEELKTQKENLEENSNENMERYAELQKEIQNRDDKRLDLLGQIEQKEEALEEAQKRKNEEWAKTGELNAEARAETQKQLKNARDELNTTKSIYQANQSKLETARDNLKATGTELGQLDKVNRELANIQLKQAGYNAEKDEGLQTLRDDIGELEAKKALMQSTTSESGKQTQQYQAQISHINNQISELEKVEGSIVDLQSQSDELNEALGQNVNKQVNLSVEEEVTRTYNEYVNPLMPGGRYSETPGYAKGTDNHPGGWAMVGEEGPELVNLPSGSAVKTNSETKDIMSGSGMSAVGSSVTQNMAAGIDSGVKAVKTSISNVMTEAQDTADEYSGERIGKDFVDSIVSGIEEAESMADVNISSLMSEARDSVWSGRSRSGIQRIRDVRDSNISLLEEEISLLTQQGASQEDLNKAKEKQTELDTLQEQKTQELQNRIRDEEAILKQLEKAYQDGNMIQSQYNEAVAQVTTNMNDLKSQAAQLNQTIGEDQVQAFQDSAEAQNDVMQSTRDLRNSNIQLLQDEISYLTREGASQSELNEAKEKQAELDRMRQAEMEDYNKQIREQEQIIADLKSSYNEGSISQAEYTTGVNEAKIEINELNSQILQLNQSMQDNQNQARNSASAFQSMADSQTNAYNTVMEEEQQAMQEKTQSMVESFQEETDTYLEELSQREEETLASFDRQTAAQEKAINRQIENVKKQRDEELSGIDEQLNQMDEEDQQYDRDQQRDEWDTQRSDINHRLEVARFMGDQDTLDEVKKERQELEDEIADQQREWSREDKRSELEAEKERIKEEAELRVEEREKELEDYQKKRENQKEHLEQKFQQRQEAYEKQREKELERLEAERAREEEQFQQEYEKQQERFNALSQQLATHVENGKMTQKQANQAWLQAVEDLGNEEVQQQIHNQEKTQSALDSYVNDYVNIGKSYADGMVDGVVNTLDNRRSEVVSAAASIASAVSGSSSSSNSSSSGGGGSSSGSGVVNNDHPDQNVQDAIDRYHRDDPDNPDDDKYFHDGGWVGSPSLQMPGLKNDEVPIIAQTGEYVLSRKMVSAIQDMSNIQPRFPDMSRIGDMIANQMPQSQPQPVYVYIGNEQLTDYVMTDATGQVRQTSRQRGGF